MMRGFDSIESMNADELLVKRRRGSKRFVIAAAVIGGLFFLVGILIGYFSHKGDSAQQPDSRPEKLDPAQYILEHVSTNYLRSKLNDFTAQSRLPGTEGSEELAQRIHSLWSASGLDDVHFTSYNVLLSFPNQSDPNKVQIVNTTSGKVVFNSSVFEPPLRPGENISTVMNFNAYSSAGKASGDVVYANYATLEDFDYLTKNLSINLTGRIVIARYGKIFRGNQVHNAEMYNASALILYTDPADVNKAFNETGKDQPYPDSWWMPSTGVQRGTLLLAGGENPDTPFYPATEYAHHIDSSERILPKIPCQPISYGDAVNILRNLKGHDSPPSWHGTLPVDYKTGPGYENNPDLKVEVGVNNFLDTRPIYHVIGIIRGREEPDRYVLLGNHHDAWVYGAVDPQSGGVALSHVVDLFGQLLKLGYRPRRTLVFCSWDAEEAGIIGSSEWVKDNLKVLYERSVAYLNVDMSVQGNFTLKAAASPLLQDALYTAAKQVPSPVSEFKTLYDLWLARPYSNDSLSNKEPSVSYSLGGGSDHAKFYLLAGVPCADIRMSYDLKKYPLSSYPLYHSQYDNLFSYENYQDPGFVYTKALTQFWAVLAYNIAEATALPMNVKRYSSAVSTFINELCNKYKEVWMKNNVNVDDLLSAVENFTAATEQFESSFSTETDLDKKPYILRMYNDKMIQLERAFIDSEGLPDRRQMKNIIFASSAFDSYSNTFFAGISDTMFSINNGLDQWDRLKQQVYIATFFIQSAARSLHDIGL